MELEQKFSARPYHDLNSPFSVDERGAFAEYIIHDPNKMPSLALGATIVIRDKRENSDVWIAGKIVGLKSISPFNPQRQSLLYHSDETYNPNLPIDQLNGPHTHQPMIIRVELTREMINKDDNSNDFISSAIQRPPSAASRLIFPNVTAVKGDASPSLEQGEPFRSKGNNPDETIGELVQRRLGISYLHYAVDPFISGVYAGDPMRLVTRHALPKLYQLEQTYGSFILGGIAKSFSHRSERDRLATRKVFSTYGGLSNLTKALEQAIGIKRFSLGATSTSLMPCEQGWVVSFTDSCGIVNRIHCRKVITTAPAFALPSLLPFVPDKQMNRISNLTYAPVMQVSVGLRNTYGKEFHAFGGLVPSCEQKPVLGILFPSACFDNRSPEGGALYSYFLGGTRHPELLEKSDDEIIRLITTGLNEMLDYPAGIVPDLIRIFRHKKAIPQYESSSADRFAAINELQKQYPGLVVAGNLKGGIGMADRIKQAFEIARER